MTTDEVFTHGDKQVHVKRSDTGELVEAVQYHVGRRRITLARTIDEGELALWPGISTDQNRR